MTEEKLEKVLREYMSFRESVRPGSFLGKALMYSFGIEPWGNGCWRGKIQEKIFFEDEVFGKPVDVITLDSVDWIYGRTRKKVLERLLEEFSDGKSPEEILLELTSLGRCGMMEA